MKAKFESNCGMGSQTFLLVLVNPHVAFTDIPKTINT